MSTLFLKLCGPMQSWGSQSRFVERDTLSEPTKSGVIGLICAALGRERSQPIEDLSALRMGVRVDREGLIKNDYHIAGKSGYMRASGKIETSDAIPSNRYYLADADFLVGLESDNKSLLEMIDAALRNPVWNISLGRKSFLPSIPVFTGYGLSEKPLSDALIDFPFHYSEKSIRNKTKTIRFAVEIISNNDPLLNKAVMVKTIPDIPLSFETRNFTDRKVAVFFEEPTNIVGG